MQSILNFVYHEYPVRKMNSLETDKDGVSSDFFPTGVHQRFSLAYFV